MRTVLCEEFAIRQTEIQAILLGYKKGEEAALVYQFGGGTSSRIPAWKCLDLSKVGNACLRDGPRVEIPATSGSSKCVDSVDLDVNPNSPYHPKRSLNELRARRF